MDVTPRRVRRTPPHAPPTPGLLQPDVRRTAPSSDWRACTCRSSTAVWHRQGDDDPMIAKDARPRGGAGSGRVDDAQPDRERQHEADDEAKHVARRGQHENPDREPGEQPAPSREGLDLARHVAVRQQHALRGCRRARAEEKRDRIVFADSERDLLERRVAPAPNERSQRHPARGRRVAAFRMRGGAEDQRAALAGRDVGDHLGGDIAVDEDDDGAAQRGAKEDGDPLGRIRRPQDETIAAAHAAVAKIPRHAEDLLVQPSVRPPP